MRHRTGQFEITHREREDGAVGMGRSPAVALCAGAIEIGLAFGQLRDAQLCRDGQIDQIQLARRQLSAGAHRLTRPRHGGRAASGWRSAQVGFRRQMAGLSPRHRSASCLGGLPTAGEKRGRRDRGNRGLADHAPSPSAHPARRPVGRLSADEQVNAATNPWQVAGAIAMALARSAMAQAASFCVSDTSRPRWTWALGSCGLTAISRVKSSMAASNWPSSALARPRRKCTIARVRASAITRSWAMMDSGRRLRPFKARARSSRAAELRRARLQSGIEALSKRAHGRRRAFSSPLRAIKAGSWRRSRVSANLQSARAPSAIAEQATRNDSVVGKQEALELANRLGIGTPAVARHPEAAGDEGTPCRASHVPRGRPDQAPTVPPTHPAEHSSHSGRSRRQLSRWLPARRVSASAAAIAGQDRASVCPLRTGEPVSTRETRVAGLGEHNSVCELYAQRHGRKTNNAQEQKASHRARSRTWLRTASGALAQAGPRAEQMPCAPSRPLLQSLAEPV